MRETGNLVKNTKLVKGKHKCEPVRIHVSRGGKRCPWSSMGHLEGKLSQNDFRYKTPRSETRISLYIGWKIFSAALAFITNQTP